MKGISFTHRGRYAKDEITYANGDQSYLLHEEDDFEVLIEKMPKGTIGFLHTIHENVFEFSYILKGSMEMKDMDEVVVLKEGDTYSHRFLDRVFMYRVIEDVEILNMNTGPYYNDYEEEYESLMEVLQKLQEVDGDTMEHCRRVKTLCMGIAYYLEIDPNDVNPLFYASTFHDVGKSKIPLEILLKPARLTDEEYEIMKKHSLYTYEMIKDHYGENIATIAFEHHEKLDGTGYPRGLKANEIGIPARIICVADAYDAMVITRPYRKGMSKEAALKELHRCEETQFDKKVIDALEIYLSECKK